jgi:hypothetical protein
MHSIVTIPELQVRYQYDGKSLRLTRSPTGRDPGERVDRVSARKHNGEATVEVT